MARMVAIGMVAIGMIAIGLLAGCAGRFAPPAPEATAELERLVGELPDGLMVLYHRHDSSAPPRQLWVLRADIPWQPFVTRPRHRHRLHDAAVASNIATITGGRIDAGEPLQASCTCSAWQLPDGGSLRLHSGQTDQGWHGILEQLGE